MSDEALKSFRDTLKGLSSFSETLKQIGLPAQTYSLPDLLDFELLSVPVEIPSQEELHEYASAGALLERLGVQLRFWRKQLPADAQPVVLAIFPGVGVINVGTLADDGFNGIVVTGMLGDVECMFLTHQANLQLLCYIEKVEEETKRRTIGFRVGGKEFQE